MKKLVLTTLLCAAVAQVVVATTFQFNLQGTAGPGLLPGNEPGSLTGGTGGEIGAGIFFDDTTGLLTINVGWGSSQGFTDLSSLANNSHLHGPTASVNGNGFTETGGVQFTLTRSSSAVTGGVFTDSPFLLTAAQRTNLFNGKYYINIHTANNGGGEIRGFLVPVNAPITQFNLQGTAGPGLLPENEPGSITGGTGGEIGAGVFFDDSTSQLTINVGWGSSQGFTDLSSLVNNSHLHGPTASINGNGFTETGGVQFTLTRSSSAVTGGVFTDSPFLLTAAQRTNLFNGKYYINIHTANNGGGELRGFLVPAIVTPPAPPTVRIVDINVADIITLKSTGTNGWSAIPEYRCGLADTNWTAVSPFTNALVNNTNTTTFGRLDAICGSSNVFLRVRNQQNP